ncbi:MAG: glycosyltransferase family 2 protein [Panacagrimonas sp.]
MRSVLAIAIPTFNRAHILKDTIDRIGSVLRQLDIPLVIRDDSDDDQTAGCVEAWKQSGLRIDYRRNHPRLGHDANLLNVLLAAEADHIWLLGDAVVPDPECMGSIVAALSGHDFVFLNARQATDERRVDHIAVDDLPSFMAERVWEFTLTGATIYGPRVLDWCRTTPCRDSFRNFGQLGIILGFMQAHADTRVTRIGQRASRSTRHPRQSYWAHQALEVFGRDWCRVIEAHAAVFGRVGLPSVLKSHARNTGILEARHLLELRARSAFSRADLRTHGAHLAAASCTPRAVAYAIASCPAALARLLRRLKFFRRRRRRRPAHRLP